MKKPLVVQSCHNRKASARHIFGLRGRKLYAACLNLGTINSPLASAVALSNARPAPSRLGWEVAKLLRPSTYVYGFSLAMDASHQDG